MCDARRLASTSDPGCSFTLVGQVRGWDPTRRHLRIFDVDLVLAPDVSSAEVAVGAVVLVRGRQDAMTGLRIVITLRQWA